ncbi:HET-domain-containing protein, partial [Pleomassaria siparia CBS 279.74]
DTSSDASFKTVQKWLAYCTLNHPRCNAGLSKTATLLPPRVIDVGLASESTVRLYETEDGQKGTYVCLSHCWGTTSKPIETTTANIDQKKKSIALSGLSKTFQDAIDFVRRLGMRYIWIDSLCIVQDDKADWFRHAKSMAAIYQHSYLTLAATWARDGTMGCYNVARDKSSNKYEASTLHSDDSQLQSVYYRQQLPHWWASKRTSRFTRDGTNFPLLSRAWVFQERILSPRVLHFGEGELLWECLEEYTCECTSDIQVFPNYPKSHHSRILESFSEVDIPAVWRQLVSEYSRLDITYPSDRLPALMGIVEPMRKVNQSRIVAGCWESCLFYDMLWSCTAKHLHYIPLPRPDPTVPSWSWMA